MTDVTELKERELALFQSNRALQLLSRCNEALIRSETESGLLATICQIAVDIGGFRLAWVGYAHEDAARTIEVQSHAGVEEGYLSNLCITWAENEPAGQSPAGLVIRHGEPVVIPDLETNESYRPWLEAARARGFRGVIALPLKDQKHTFGVLVLYLPEARQPLPDEIRLLGELADNMAFGIVNIRTRLDRRRLHTAVAQVAASVSAATSSVFFEQLTRNMVTALGAKAGFVAQVLPGEPVTARTIAVVVDDQVTANFDYLLQGTPCETFFTSDTCVIHEQVARQFPLSPTLAALGAEGFVGRRLDTASGTFIGQMVVIFREPLKDADFVASTLQIFAARAAAELERQETDTKLREQAALLDKAQDAILVRDLEGRITYWNKSAERLYGWTAEQALGSSARELLYSEPSVFDLAMTKLLDAGEWAGELPQVRKDGRRLVIECRWTLVKDDEGRPKSILAINTDITERKQAEAERNHIFNLSLDLLCVANFDGRLEQVNLAWTECLGWTAEELTTRPMDEFILPEDRDATHRTRARIQQGEQVRSFENRYRCKDGGYRWLSWSAHPLLESRKVFAVARDVTERRKNEAQLRLLETCVSRLNDIVLITEAEPIDGPGPRILYVNDAFTRVTGFTREEAIGKTPRILQGPKTQRATLDRIRAGLKARQPVREEIINYTKSGEEYWIEIDLVPIADATGSPSHFIAVERDITQRKMEEEKLRESEARVRAVLDSSLNAVVVMDAAGKILDWNKRAEKIFDWSYAEAVGRELAATIIPPRFHEAHWQGMERYLACGEGPILNRLIEMSAMRRNGDEFPVEMSIASMKTGDRVTFCGFIADITERKRAEAALAESQQKYRDLVETSHDLIWAVDAEGRITYLNPACRTIYGREPEEMIGRLFLEFVPPDQYAKDLAVFAAALQSGHETLEYSSRVYRKDGSIVSLSANARVVCDDQGRVVGSTGISRDVTASERAQEALAESEARFRGLFDQAAVGMCLASNEGAFLRTNSRFCEIVGYSPAELLQRDCVATTHPEEREMEAKIVARMLAGELQTAAWEKRYVHKAGHAVWCNLTLSLLPGGRGRPPQFVAVVEDITERRAAIEQLRHREELLRIAGKIARMGGWSVDFPEDRITWSDEVCAIHDVPAGTVPALDQALGFYTPESRPVIESAFSLCASEGTPFDVELEVLTAKGRRAWVRSIGQAERDKAGAIRRVQGAFQDITEQKKAESEALRAAETLAGIVQIQQEIASADLAQAEVMHLIAERARMLTGATGGVVEFAEGSDMVYAVGTGVVADRIGMRPKREGSLSGLAFATGEVLSCEDTETDPRVDLPSCRMIGVRSMIVAPLRVGEKTIGVLKVLSGEPQAFSRRDVHNLQILVETLGVVIQRQRAAEALLASVEEFRTLAELMPQIVWITRPDGWTVYFNQHWMDYTGLTLEESLGHGWNQPFHPEDQQRAWDAWQLATATVGTYMLECRLRRADGEYCWWLIRGEPQKDAAGKVLKWFGTCTDIHSLKLAELEITRTNRALKMLSACSEALIHAVDESDLLKVICEIAVASGGYRMAWVGFAQEDAKRTIQPMAHAGVEAGYLSEAAISWEENTPEGSGPGGRTIRTGQPNMSEDMEQDASFHWRDIARQRGYRSVICLPLRSGDRTFGLLGLYSAEVLQAGAEELKLLQELADDLAFGIGHLRAQRESERIHKVVTRVATAVSASTGAEFFEQLAESMAGTLGAAAGFVAEMLPGEPPGARTVAAMVDGKKIENFDYSFPGTPCVQLLADDEYVVADRVAELFPKAPNLASLGAEAYVGRRLTNAAGEKIGLIFVLFREPLKETAFFTATLRIFAARATSELERQKSDKQLREQAALLDAAHDAILVRDLDDRVLYWNKGAERLYGWAADEAIGRKASGFLHGNSTEVNGALQEVLKKDRWEGELHHAGKDGRTILVQASWTLLRDADGRPTSVLAINSDLTEKKKLEAQFLRAQRMESIGTLAGGIAHDLNNVLAPILMSVELLKLTCESEEDQELLETLSSSAQRGANLVSQVLGFARGVEGQRVPVNVGQLIQELTRVMRETFPKNLTIEPRPSANIWSVTGDPTQIHQVILNLCVNARDAMPTGGTLTIGAESIVVDATYASMNPSANPGPYVVIKVEDTGTGIPPELVERVFEPFFTTKETGQGTGLGLSTTAAIVKSHGGFINLYSEVGKGTKFKVYFPADASKEASEKRSVEQTRLPRGNGELVLVVDDEESIRSVAKSTLERFGYSVMLASHGAEAIAVYAQNQSAIAVVLTDMAMPIMDGPTMIIALKSINPKVRIIGSSGLSSNGATGKAIGAGVEHFIPKPYTAEAMLKCIRASLDSR